MARPMTAKAPVEFWDTLDFEALTNTELMGNKQTAKGPEGRRKRLLGAITIQEHLWEDPHFTVVRRVRKDGVMVTKSVSPDPWWKSDDGTHALTARYGKEPIPLQPGLYTVYLDDAKMMPFFKAFREKVRNGAFDEVLSDLHLKICAAFKKE